VRPADGRLDMNRQDQLTLATSILEWIEANIAVTDLEDIYPNFTKQLADRYAPEDIFSDGQLADWAEANGFVRE
jgi:hypothetical protein